MPRPARSEDLPGIMALLAASDLPTAGVSGHLDGFVVEESEADAIVAVAGLEVHGRLALLRSLAVARAQQGRGLARALCDRLEADAAGRGLEALYLLTETAEGFFTRRGYAVVARARVPEAIAATQEFTSLCPESAVCMTRKL